MSLFPNAKIILSVGPFSITWYAFFIVSGAMIAYFLSANNIKKMGYNKELAEDLFYGALPVGIVGARMWYVAFEWSRYVKNPIEMLYIWEGGLGLYGGVFAGMLYGYFYTKKHKLSFLRWADAIVPNILIAQAMGRWGNFINQEAYGRVVEESFYRYFPGFIKNRMFIDGFYREPTFLYESSLNLIGWCLIVLVYKKYGTRKRGDLFYSYLAWYGVVRFFVEGLRSDSLYFMGMRASQMTSVVLIVLGVLGIVGWLPKLKKRKPVVLFDLDGTILDTDALIFASYRHVFGMYEPTLELTDDLLATFLGPSLRDTFTKHSQQDVELLMKEYIAYNKEHHGALAKPINHAMETIQALKEDGHLVGIVSTKFKDTILLGLALGNMEEAFDVVVGLDDVSAAKPSPEGIFRACDLLGVSYDWLIYVGDNGSDILAGKNAGAYTIGVSWSKRVADIFEEKPDAMVSDLMEVVKVVKEAYQ